MKSIYKTIIVGIDDSEKAVEVLQRAIKIAGSAEAALVIVSVIPYNQIVSLNYSGMDPTMLSQYVISEQNEIEPLISERDIYIKTLLDTLDTTDIKDLKTIVEINDPDSKLIEVSKEHEDALIVVGASNKKRFERFFLGSVARQIVTTAPVDVLLVK